MIKTPKNYFAITLIFSLLVSMFGTYTIIRFYTPKTEIINNSNWNSWKVIVENIKDIEWNIKAIAKNVSPSVVSIVISKDVQTYKVDPYGFFYEPGGVIKQKVWWGSGFFINKDWYILTNKHVVSDANASYTVITYDGQEFSWKVLAFDPTTDLAVIKVDKWWKNIEFTPVKFSSNIIPEIGSMCIAIGNALAEFQNTLTLWVISWLDRKIEASTQDSQELLTWLLQTDAAINPWNSGWPLVNLSWEVVWINTAIAAWANGLWFAIPLSQGEVDYIMNSITKFGKIKRAYLGIKYTPLTEAVAKQLKINSSYWIYIWENWVVANSPAEKSWLKANDTILEADWTKLDKIWLKDYIKNKFPWDIIKLKVLRDGKTIDVDLVLGDI